MLKKIRQKITFKRTVIFLLLLYIPFIAIWLLMQISPMLAGGDTRDQIYYGARPLSPTNNPLRDQLRECEVLGAKIEEPVLTGTYGDVGATGYDRYVWSYNFDRRVEGYYEFPIYVKYPTYYFSDSLELVDEWELKGGSKVKVTCGNRDSTNIVPGDPHSCKLFYNDELLREDVRNDALCNDNETKQTCSLTVEFTIYSDKYSDTGVEYLVISSWHSGSKDLIHVYRLVDGAAELLKFNYDQVVKEEMLISNGMYELYATDSEEEFVFRSDPVQLVTYFHEPSMGADNNVEGYFRVWDITENELVHKERVVDLYREGEVPWWL